MPDTQQLARFEAKAVAISALAVAMKIKQWNYDDWLERFREYRKYHPKATDQTIERELRQKGFRPDGHQMDNRFRRAINLHVWANNTTDEYVLLSPDDMFVLNSETMEKEIYGS